MAFDVTKDEYTRLFSALFQSGPAPAWDAKDLVRDPGPTHTETEYLDKLKKSSRVDDESVTYRKLETLRGEISSIEARMEFVAWLVESRFRAFVWNGFLVILNDNVSEIREVLGPFRKI